MSIVGSKDEILQAATEAWEILADVDTYIDNAIKNLVNLKVRIARVNQREVQGGIRVVSPDGLGEGYNESDTMP